MKEVNLGSLSTYCFNGRAVIAIEEKWKDFFTTSLVFEVVITKDGRYTLRGPVVQSSQRDPTVAQEDVIHG